MSLPFLKPEDKFKSLLWCWTTPLNPITTPLSLFLGQFRWKEDYFLKFSVTLSIKSSLPSPADFQYGCVTALARIRISLNPKILITETTLPFEINHSTLLVPAVNCGILFHHLMILFHYASSALFSIYSYSSSLSFKDPFVIFVKKIQ